MILDLGPLGSWTTCSGIPYHITWRNAFWEAGKCIFGSPQFEGLEHLNANGIGHTRQLNESRNGSYPSPASRRASQSIESIAPSLAFGIRISHHKGHFASRTTVFGLFVGHLLFPKSNRLRSCCRYLKMVSMRRSRGLQSSQHSRGIFNSCKPALFSPPASSLPSLFPPFPL